MQWNPQPQPIAPVVSHNTPHAAHGCTLSVRSEFQGSRSLAVRPVRAASFAAARVTNQFRPFPRIVRMWGAAIRADWGMGPVIGAQE